MFDPSSKLCTVQCWLGLILLASLDGAAELAAPSATAAAVSMQFFPGWKHILFLIPADNLPATSHCTQSLVSP
jgi:hypothetical protein